MPTTVTVIFFILLISFLVWFRIMRMGDTLFLRLISRYPDAAYDWFMAEECWLVIEHGEHKAGLIDKPEPDGYSAPFTLVVPKLNGRVVVVYGRLCAAEESKRRFTERYGGRGRRE